ncbi:MAG: hydrolase [Oscillatoriales cyanobacterium CG2_30_44_21]|nr:MAG: hydrolase [Oscillatoriales cyanobacterium CG2_30_44_21]
MRSPLNIDLKTPRPETIFLDAVGTLFGVKGSVGLQYAQVAQSFNVVLDPDLVNRAFYQSFQSASKIAFPDLAPVNVPEAEYQWWRSLAEDTFKQTGDLIKFADFESFFKEIFDCFATTSPWFVYEETRTVLEQWRSQGIKLGVLSNFDSRIYPVIEALDLQQYFDSITISTEVGAAKPDAGIFVKALSKHGLEDSPNLAWHIGDSFEEDYLGAEAVGIKAIWLNRDRRPSSNPAKQSALTIDQLTDI